FKETYTRILGAIDKDPSLENRVDASGVTKVTNGVSLELMDSLQTQLEEKDKALAMLENARLALEQQITKSEKDAQAAREKAQEEAPKLREAMDTQRRQLEAEAATREEKTRGLVDEMTNRNRRGIEELDGQIAALKRQV